MRLDGRVQLFGTAQPRHTVLHPQPVELSYADTRMDVVEQFLRIVGLRQTQEVGSQFRRTPLNSVEPTAVVGGGRDKALAHEAVDEVLFLRLQERRIAHAKN